MADKKIKNSNFLFKYDMSEKALARLSNKRELAFLLEPGDMVKLKSTLLRMLPKNNPTAFSWFVWNLKQFFMGDSDKEKLNEMQIRTAVYNSGLLAANKEAIVEQLINEYPLNVIDKIEEISVIFKILIFMGFLMFMFWITGIGGKIQGFTAQINAVDEPTLFQTIIGLTFQLTAFASFLMAMIILPLIKVVQYKNNDVDNRPQKFKENFLQTIPNQIMNLGIITMIFAIVGIIFFREEQLLDVAVYFKTPALVPFWPVHDYTRYADLQLFGFDSLKFLLVAGGITEAAAFYLGFRFPEKLKSAEQESEIRLEDAAVDKIVEGIKQGLIEAQKQATSEAISEGVVNALTKLSFQKTPVKKD